VITSSRSERGWQGRRRIAVLVSIAGILGIAVLGSASTASAANVANCKAKLAPKGKSNAGTSAKLSFVCDAPVRTFGVGANTRIKGYGAASAGAATAFLNCEGLGVGYGCGVLDRAAPGTQPPGTTGWTTVPPFPAGGSKADKTPLTCNGYKRVQGDLGQPKNPDGPPDFPPTLNAIVTQPCTQQIEPGTKVVQSVKLGSSPCAGGPNNPFQLFLFVGGEPAVTSFTAPNSLGPGGDSATVGEYISPPIRVNLKAYQGCSKSGESKSGGAKQSTAPATHYPITCSGSVFPATTPASAEAKLNFTCSKNIRAFAVYTNKTIGEPGDEPVVAGSSGGGVNEGALHQCQGDIPGAGFGCGIVDRQAQSTGLPNGQGISAGNSAEQNISFESSPCQRTGEPKAKVWVIAMGEPITSATTVGEFTSAPQQLAVSGFGKCKGGKKKK
jgi:hypothetical protein